MLFRSGATMIYVTHDQVEAMTMADRIVVLQKGRIEQAGSPLDLYNCPTNQFVAGFIGSPKMNFLSTTLAVDGQLALAGGGTIALPVPPGALQPGDSLTLGIRPEHIEVADGGLAFAVTLTEQLGGNTVLYGTLPSGQPLVVQLVGQASIKRGDTLSVRFPPQHCHVFDQLGQAVRS